MKNILYAPLKLIPKSWPHRDKWGHALVGTALYATLAPFIDPLLALFIVAAVGASKEIIDEYGEGRPSLWDFAATVVPAGVMWAVITVVQ